MKVEFINRIDEIVLFNKLNRENIKAIIKNQLLILEKRLENRDLKLSIDENVYDTIFKFGFSEEFGARPIKRLIKKHIENKIAKRVLQNNIVDKTVILKVTGDKLDDINAV